MGVPAYRLEEAGFSRSQVEALSEFLQTEAARRSDLMESEHRLGAEIKAVEHRLDARITETEHRLQTQITEVKATQRLHNWMIGFNIGLTLLVLGKLFIGK